MSPNSQCLNVNEATFVLARWHNVMSSEVTALLFQAIRFSAVGIASTLTYYVVAASLGLIGLPAYGANALGYGSGAVVSFLGHFYFTFEKRTDHLIYLGRFIVLTVIGFILSNILVFCIVDLIGASFQIAAATIPLIVPIVTWVGGRYWAFK